jgi:hypothetical protein
MENNLKNELNRIFTLMEYSYSNSKNFINEGDYTQKSEEKEEFPFRMARMGGDKIRIEDGKTGDKIDIDFKLKDEFIKKLTEFRTI